MELFFLSLHFLTFRHLWGQSSGRLEREWCRKALTWMIWLKDSFVPSGSGRCLKMNLSRESVGFSDLPLQGPSSGSPGSGPCVHSSSCAFFSYFLEFPLHRDFGAISSQEVLWRKNSKCLHPCLSMRDGIRSYMGQQFSAKELLP